MLERDEVALEEIREAYRLNLEIVLKEVRRLLTILSGRVVATSDHGESLGEDPLLFYSVDSSYTRLVPWLEIYLRG